MTTGATAAARPAAVLLAAAVLLVITGCTSRPESSAARARDHVASAVHVALDRHGVPVQDGIVNCEGPGPDGAIYCEATTAYEPQAEVLARFSTDPASATGGCPGNLRITVGGAQLTSTSENPCI